MKRTNSLLLQIITYCLLLEITHALIGTRVYLAKPHQYTYVVSLTIRNEVSVNDMHLFHVCTGTLIRPKSILTAAHCLVQRLPHDIEVVAGSVSFREGKKYYPESWITFDEWNQDPTWRYRMNDIAVIILQGNGITDIEPALIPLRFHNNLNDHTHFVLAGWGETEKGNKVKHLKTGNLLLVSNEECSTQGTMLKGKIFAVPPNYFCSKAEPYVLSSCGDGGAPILTRSNQLVGINIGTCPKLEASQFESEEFVNQNLMNSHLHISYYKHFIERVWK